MIKRTYDYLVIGSGIIGVSVAYHLKLKHKNAKILLLEKESKPFQHQTSHNSGVIHAGIYYKPDSLKSNFCIQGLHDTYNFCDKHNVPYKKIGKLIVATNSDEAEKLNNLFLRAKSLDLNLKLLSKKEVKKIEPNLNSLESFFSPKTGIIDWAFFANVLLKCFVNMGGQVRFDSDVTSINENHQNVVLKCNQLNEKIYGLKLISCGGLQSDRLAKMVGLNPNSKVVPFRGDYYVLHKKFNNLFNHLIYPVPDLKTPFLGVHFTKHINGFMMIGPNASLNFSRESYERYSFNIKDTFDYFLDKGFWKLLFKYKEFMAHELLTSFSRYFYLKDCKRYYSNLRLSDLVSYHAGIRAQTIAKDGSLIDDFLFENTKNSLFVLNAPSPAATSSLPIGKFIADKF